MHQRQMYIFLVGGTQTNYVVIPFNPTSVSGRNFSSDPVISNVHETARSKQLDTKSWHFQAKTEKLQHHSARILRCTLE